MGQRGLIVLSQIMQYSLIYNVIVCIEEGIIMLRKFHATSKGWSPSCLIAVLVLVAADCGVINRLRFSILNMQYVNIEHFPVNTPCERLMDKWIVYMKGNSFYIHAHLFVGQKQIQLDYT